MGDYRSQRPENEKKPSIEIRLPVIVRYLETPLNALILKLDAAEERETRIEQKLDQVKTALDALLGEPEKRE